MDDTQARVVAVRGKYITVANDTDQGCAGCRSKSSCSSTTARELEIDAETARQIHVGDIVSLSLAEGTTLRAAGLAYVLPLGCFLVGLVPPALAGGGDGATLLGGVIGLAAGLFLSSALSRRLRVSLQPSVRVLHLR